VSVGFPGFVNNVVLDTVENIGRVLAAAGKLFADHEPKQSPADHTDQVLFGPAGAPAAPPPTPNGDSGLNSGATGAGEDYNAGVDAAQLTDQKLAELLKQIFASNQAAREKVSSILSEITNKQKQIAPEMGDPASVSAFGQFLDQKFGEIQKVLTDAQVDGKTQAAILDALGDEYHANGPNPLTGGSSTTAQGDADSGATGTSTEPSGSSDTAPAGDSAAGQDPLIDPLAGMGIGAPTGMDPLSAMSPALAGLSALPGAMGGGLASSASPLDAPGSLGQLGALADRGFADAPPADTDTKPKDDFSDKPAASTTDGKPPANDPAEALKDDQHHDHGQPAASPTGNSDSTASPSPTPHDAAPASAPAPGDPGRAVTLPDGRVVTAPDDKIAAAMRSVLSGTSVPDAFSAVDLPLPPPGTPVIDPADPAHLDPGSLAQFQSREPVMAMGDGKIWLDGQLQPIGALGSSSDFLGWSKPPTKASPQTAAPGPPSAS
jgi:hypothetical protein